jgi:hypothetical protein
MYRRGIVGRLVSCGDFLNSWKYRKNKECQREDEKTARNSRPI